MFRSRFLLFHSLLILSIHRCWRTDLVVIVCFFLLLSGHAVRMGPSHVSLYRRITKSDEKKKNNIFNLFSCSLIFVGSQNCHWFFIGLVIVANFYSSFDCFINPQIVPSRCVWAFSEWISQLFSNRTGWFICEYGSSLFSLFSTIFMISTKLIWRRFSFCHFLNCFELKSVHLSFRFIQFLYSISIKSLARHISIYSNSIISKLPTGCHLINPSLYSYWN